MTLAADNDLLHTLAPWSREVRVFEAIVLHREQRALRELAAAGEAVLAILPLTPPFAPYRTAVDHLLGFCGVTLPYIPLSQAERSPRRIPAA